jgi:Protein of unknown function (DUF2628)
MSVYIVHEPPLRHRAGAGAAPDANRFVFVRDGFSFWAFLLGPLWMLRHRMWLVVIGYLVITIGLQVLMRLAGGSAMIGGVISLLIALLVGLEAGTLRRFTLGRRRWQTIGVVSGDDLEDAERRFFDAWVRRSPSQPVAPVAATTAAPPRMPQAPTVVGLFPEPGAPR